MSEQLAFAEPDVLVAEICGAIGVRVLISRSQRAVILQSVIAGRRGRGIALGGGQARAVAAALAGAATKLYEVA